MAANVSKYCRDIIVTLLTDGTVGFNATLETVSADYAIPTFTIDFTSTSKNFFQSWLAPKDVIETTTMKFPFMCFYTSKSQNQNTQKFATFAGSIMMGLDTYISIPQSQAQNRTEDQVDAVESTLYTIFNSADNYSFYKDVLYNGDLLIKRGSIYKGGQNWIQPLYSVLTFDLIVS